MGNESGDMPGFRQAMLLKSKRDPFERYQRALFDTIATAEGGEYDNMYGPKGKARIVDFSDHPRNPSRIDKGENKGKMSSAAGRYQIQAPTWDPYAKKMRLEDFSPHNQDRAAWKIAQDAYRRVTKGGDLDEALMSADPSTIKAAGGNLAMTWTSLPGGKEQRMTPEQFLDTYQMNLRAREGRMPIPQGRPFEDRLSVTIPPTEQDGPLQMALAGKVEELRQHLLRPAGGDPGTKLSQDGGMDPASSTPPSDAPGFWDRLFGRRRSLKDAAGNWFE
ncbi:MULTISPECIES: hypothetical protein [unclassified Ensifer]|uniref:hypothetical protein n=1 Tax=unclassified Ensifer TaxID=2633371 RepID=UPI001146BEB0|nr:MULTISPECIES: hypothetical protein [unclassified Ensifer]